MDLVDFRQEVFRDIQSEFSGFVEKLGRPLFQFTFRAARHWATTSCSTPRERPGTTARRCWSTSKPYRALRPVRHRGLRFPVQLVLRPGDGERHYAGQIASGMVQNGVSVLALPSGRSARVTGIRVAGNPTECAAVPASVSIMLDRELDLGRGDMLVDPASPPAVTQRFQATLLWLSAKPLSIGQAYLVKHTSRYVCASVVRLIGVIDPVTLEQRMADHVVLNEFCEAELETHQPLYADCYGDNRSTGAFILVDPISNETLAAGMISADLAGRTGVAGMEKAANGMAIWFTGLSSAGKSTISKAVYEKLWAKGHKVELLDGDVVRQHLTKGLGFSKQDRDENIRRIGFVAELLARNGVIVLVAAISPYRQVREEIRRRIDNFIEVYVNAPLQVVEQRDVNGIYRRCRAGEIHGVTGIDDPYEPPLAPEVECHTDRETSAESARKVIQAVEDRLSRGSW